MVTKTYIKLFKTDNQIRDEDNNNSLVDRSIESIIDDSNGTHRGGCIMDDEKIEKFVMDIYRFTRDTRKCGGSDKTAEEDVRYLSQRVQIFSHFSKRSQDLCLSYFCLTPQESCEEELDEKMQEMGYSRFEFNETYKERLSHNGVTFDDVFKRNLTFEELRELFV